jgi:hypothetical protein
MRKFVCHASAPDSDHPATGLVVLAEIVLFGLTLDHLPEKAAQLLIACPLAHRRFDIELEMAAEARPQVSFAGEP